MDSIDLDRIPYYISKLQLPKCLLELKHFNWTQLVDKIINNVNKKIPRYQRKSINLIMFNIEIYYFYIERKFTIAVSKS